MPGIRTLLDNNKNWADGVNAADPTFFTRLSHQQAPEYLWIGCSDSRVPANEIVGLLPGELFVHRNVANLVVHADLNCLSVVQYAVEMLRVKHIIVCGHYGCGGIEAAQHGRGLGLIDNWLRNVQDVMKKHEAALVRTADPVQRARRLCELNVIEQAANVCDTTIIQNAWHTGQEITVHALVYGIEDGLLKPLGFSPAGAEAVPTEYHAAMESIYGG